ncbi:MAG: DNA-binding protein [Clostridia bacterium]|nr:DNA-binding protein [Clostridia bacterium]
MKLEQHLYMGTLLDFYGGMLTQNQQKITRSYVDFNASLSEIAEQNGTTRQAVSDVLRRSIKKMQDLENALQLVAKYHSILNKIPAIASKITTDQILQQKINFEFEQLLKTLED